MIDNLDKSEGFKNVIKITDLKDMLKKTENLYSKKIAYKIRIDENEYKEITHKQVREMINFLGTALIDIGLKGKRIAVIGENRYEWEIAYLSIVCGTGIVVPLDRSLPANELKDLIKRSEVEAIFYTEKYEDVLKRAKLEGIGKLKHLISMDRKIHEEGIYAFEELVEKGKQLVKNGNNEFIDAEIDSEAMSIMLFTSGTTSKSKIVALCHRNLCSNLMDIAAILDVDSNDVFLSFLPIHHVFECTVGFLFALYSGAQTVFCDGIRHIIDNLYEYKVSVMASVPAIYERLFKIIRKQIEKSGEVEEILLKEEKYKNSSMEEKKKVFKKIHDMLGGNIKLMISGAAALDREIEQKFRNLGLNLVQGYGLTETSPVVAIGTIEHHKCGSIGRTVPSVEARIDASNKEGIGELVVKGPNVMLEYYENKEETKKVLESNGWFHTGDLAKIDEEGYIFICGRKKSVIVLKNGKNIFPEEMEGLINKIEGVEESFIFGKQISDDVNDIKIFAKLIYNREIVENTYKVTGKEEIYRVLADKIKEINNVMPRYKSIKGILISEIPLVKTTTNKIKRQENMKIILKEEGWN